MRVKVTANICEIQNDVILNSGEYNINKFYFDFSEEYIDNYVKKALFVGNDGTVYEMVIANDECNIPYDILKNPGTYTFGVYAYELEDNELKLRYSPEPTHFYVNKGSYIENSISPTQPTPDEFEQYYQAMQTLIANAKPELIDYIDNNLPTIEIGSTTTLPEGSQATVENVGTERNPIFNFGIPKGDKGTTDYNELVNKPDLTIYSTIDETANKIKLDINNQTYQVKAMIYDKNNILLSESNVIDLPLESVVVSGTYDAETKKIILTLENGNTIEIPLGDLISGLQSEITENNKLASDLVDDTESSHKFVTSSDKTSWTNKVGSISKNGVNLPIDANKNVNISVPTTTNDLINDSGFITNNANGLLHYYNKTAADTRFSLTTETGYNLTLTIDPLTYIMTAVLKTRNNQVLSTQSIDLPLETMVVGAAYDSATKEIVLTLKNGQEVRFSVADLVSGLQSEITENNKLASDLVDDTNNTNKFVTAEEKTQITTNENDISDIKDEQEIQNEQLAELEMLYNAFPTVSDEDTTIELNNTAKVKFREIDLKGNTSQVVIPEDQGTSVSNTSIYVSDVNTDKENTIEMSGNTYQETISEEQGTSVSNTSIYVSDVNTNKENTIEISGNTYQANAILPSEYTQVDYIRSTGGQYIDTGINADNKLRTILDISFINPTNANQTMGAINIGTPNKRYHLLSGSNSIAFWVNDANYGIINLASTDRHLWDLNVPEGKVVLDNTTTTTIPTNIDNVELNFWLFGRNSNATQYKGTFKLWACKMYYNGTLVRDFIPCYRNSDNEIGLYDLVNNVFYINQGTGAFIYDSVASIPNPSYPQNIEVVTGTQNVKVCGKNLLDKNNLNIQNIYLSNSNKITGTNVGMGCIYIPCQPNTTYTVSKTEVFGNDRFCIFDTEDIAVIGNYALSYAGQRSGYNSATSLTLTTSPNAKYLYMFIKANDTNPAKTLQEIAGTIQVEKNNIATTYETFQGTTYQVNLSNIELCKISTYQDRIYKRNDKWYLEKNIGKITLNGSETGWYKGSDTSGNYYINTNIIHSISNYIDALSNYFINAKSYPNNRAGLFAIRDGGNSIMFNSSETSVGNWRTWLGTHNTNVYYPQQTSTTEITDTNLVNQLNALYNATIHPITNINTDTSNLLPYIDLHYNVVTPSPSPKRPSNIDIVTGTQNITITNGDDTQSTTYQVNLGNMELCKIGTYQDRIYKRNDKWYLYKQIGKVTLNGTETVTRKGTNTTGYYRFAIDIGRNIYSTDTTQEDAPFYCNKFVNGSRSKSYALVDCIFPTDTTFGYSSFGIYYDAIKEMTTTQFQNWLSQNGIVVYYPYATPTTTEITDTNLVNQLNALYNATIHPITNINTDTSNLLPYIDLHYNFVTPSPSPSRPSVVNVVKGNNAITISNSDNTESQNYPINLGNMELCKIGTYQDYIYESNGNWYKHSEIGKVVLNGTEDWRFTSNGNAWFIPNWASSNNAKQPTSYDAISNSLSNYFINVSRNALTSVNNGFGIAPTGAFNIKHEDYSTSSSDFTGWLSTHNVIAYYQLATPTDTQITDTTLITQLNNIKKTYSYDTQTNISQTNTDKTFIIYAEAIRSLKDVFE